MTNKIYIKIIPLLITLLILFSSCSLSGNNKKLTYSDTLFDTVVQIELYDCDNEEVLTGVKELCRYYDTLFSKTNEASEILKINNAAGDPVEVSPETIELLKLGKYYGNLSVGKFDITIGAVSKFWDFKSETPALPDSTVIVTALNHVNYESVVIEGNTVTLSDPASSIDVGGIAKGFIADKIAEYLKKNHVRHALISLGGNILAIGSKPDGSKYNIGIQKPFDETGTPLTSVKVSDLSVVTTGNYQRYFKIDDKLYHHVLDPKTGYPCENSLLSVTIITESSAKADALSTICYLYGYEKAMNLIDQEDNVDAVFVLSGNTIKYSNNFMKTN